MSSSNNRGRFHSPPVELPSSNAQNFFEEAKITQTEENELKRKFNKFCSRSDRSDGEEDSYLNLSDFCRMLQHYECASAQHFEAYFYAIDRNRDDKLDFTEFFLGCCAADPSTVHILNSFTGYERSQYIFDFYDVNRSNTLEFNEFAKLTADCLSVQAAGMNDEQARRQQALEKARDLGTLEDTGSLMHFTCIKFKRFYEFIQHERLRGTSRLFRFNKSIIKPRGSHHSRRGTSGRGSDTDEAQAEEEVVSDTDELVWQGFLLDLDRDFQPEEEPPGAKEMQREGQLPPLQPYTQLLPPAPAPLRPDAETANMVEAKSEAQKILQNFRQPNSDSYFQRLAQPQESEGRFTLVGFAQLKNLCHCALRLMEKEEMVITTLQPPVKVFGSIHGQVLDLMSMFKWYNNPLEEVPNGDIMYMSYVFLGNYVDRGSYQLDVICLLLSLKILYPRKIILLRGMHENRHLNAHLGFKAECERRLGVSDGPKIWELMNRVFENMSLAANVGGTILALGPGALPPSLSRVEQLRRYRKPLVLPHASQPRAAQPSERLSDQVLLEMFTPLPLLPTSMGAREANPDQLKLFCSQNKLASIVRSKAVVPKGFAFDCEGRSVTVTSCVNYCDHPTGNDAAHLVILKEEESPNFLIRPRIVSARVPRLVQAIVRPAPDVPLRWRQQQRDVTPQRVDQLRSQEGVPGDDWCGLIITPDRSVEKDPDAQLCVCPVINTAHTPDLRQNFASSFSNNGADNNTGIEERMTLSFPHVTKRAVPERRSLGSKKGPSNPSAKASLKSEDLKGRPSGAQRALTSGKAPSGASSDASSNENVLGQSRGKVKEVLPADAPLPIGGAAPQPAREDHVPSPGSKTSAPESQRPAWTPGGGPLSSKSLLRNSGDRLSLGTGASGRDAKQAITGVGAGGSATPQSGGPAAGHERRHSNGGRTRAEQTGTRVGSRSPTGPVVPSPKTVTPPGGSRGKRGETSARDGQGLTSPRNARSLEEDGMSAAGGEPDGRDGNDTFLMDPQALAQLLNEGQCLLNVADLPQTPSVVIEDSPEEYPRIVYYLCRLWVEAGLTDVQWSQALQMFEQELYDQPPHKSSHGKLGDETREGRWTLETFSMWLLKRGRRLRECSQWFRAFDFDQDEMIGIADFLQGLIAAVARAPPNTLASFSRALALYRLFDLEKKKSLEESDLIALIGDTKLSIGGQLEAGQLSPRQIAHRALDFEFFRTQLLPLAVDSTSFRLQIFAGPSPPEA